MAASSKTGLKPSARPAAPKVAAKPSLPLPVRIAAGIAIAAVAALIALLVMTQLPVFVITSIDAESTEHVPADAIARLAEIEQGTTLLSINVDEVAEKVSANPWVGSVTVEREFPDRIRIAVEERRIAAVVLMGTGNMAWYMGPDGVWIEPFNIETTAETSGTDLAQNRALELGCVLVHNASSTLSPMAGAVSDDPAIEAVIAYLSTFSEDFLSQVIRFSAPSREAIAVTLASGVEISLGAPTSIEAKEAVIREILEQHPEQITFINVRIPSKPSYRLVGTESVEAGSGVMGEEGYDEPRDDSGVPSVAEEAAGTTEDGGIRDEAGYVYYNDGYFDPWGNWYDW